jgi:hypothetical protein
VRLAIQQAQALKQPLLLLTVLLLVKKAQVKLVG